MRHSSYIFLATRHWPKRTKGHLLSTFIDSLFLFLFLFLFLPLSFSLSLFLSFLYVLIVICLSFFSLHVFLALFFSPKSCKKGKFSPTIWWREMAGIKYQFDICASNQFTILSQFSFRIFVVATLPLNLFSDLFWCSRNSDKCATFFLIMFMHVSIWRPRIKP